MPRIGTSWRAPPIKAQDVRNSTEQHDSSFSLSAMSNRQLRIRVEAVMEALFNPSVLPPRAANMAVINFPWFPRAPSAAALAATATQAQVATIPRLDVAFNLMGSSAELGFGFDNAAEQIMGTVVAWIGRVNGVPFQRQRRRRFGNIYFLVPPLQRGKYPLRKSAVGAWKKAWDRYVISNPPPPDNLTPTQRNLMRHAHTLTTHSSVHTSYNLQDRAALWAASRNTMLDPFDRLKNNYRINWYTRKFNTRTRGKLM